MGIAGQLRVLTDDQMQAVHEKACQLLGEKGMVFEADDCVEVFRRNGVKCEGNTVFISKELVEKCVAQVPKSFRFAAPNQERSVTIGEGLLIHPAGGEVFMRDFDGTHRKATLADFANLQKLYQACPNVDIAGYQPVSPDDVAERVRGLYCVLESYKNSDKPILSPMDLETVQKKEELVKLLKLAGGSESYLEENYATWHIVCPNSPYFFSNFACDGIRIFAENNQPICIVSAPMSGITSPVFLLSTLVLVIAESLAGLVLAQLVRPGVPVVLSASLTYGYMRTASWECASPDTALMLAACVQMVRHYYDLPSRAQAGVTSSKTIDYQAGMETMQSLLFTALAGVNLTSQSVSALSNLMTSSLEKTVLDDELISRVRWMTRGMAFSDEQLGMADLLGAAPKSDFLMAESTLDHFRDFWAPSVSDWRGEDEWLADGSKDVLEQAHAKVEQILAAAPASLLDPEQEKAMLEYIQSVEKDNS